MSFSKPPTIFESVIDRHRERNSRAWRTCRTILGSPIAHTCALGTPTRNRIARITYSETLQGRERERRGQQRCFRQLSGCCFQYPARDPGRASRMPSRKRGDTTFAGQGLITSALMQGSLRMRGEVVWSTILEDCVIIGQIKMLVNVPTSTCSGGQPLSDYVLDAGIWLLVLWGCNSLMSW